MKKISILFLNLLLVSCSPQKQHYVAKVYQENSNFGELMTDNSIEAINDVEGYLYGYSFYLTCKKSAEDLKNGTVTGFNVYDQNGTNLKEKLSQHQIDSVQNIFKDSPMNK